MKKSILFWMSAVLLMMAEAGLSSCNNDDSNENAGDKAYIITNQPSAIGVSYAILAGEFYPDNIPSVYNIPVLRLGMELSTTEEFRDDNKYSAYSTGIEGNHMEVTINGLTPDTKYYYRAFIDMGTMKLYGEKKTFTTLTMQLACNVGDATDISFSTASIKISFNESIPALSSEGVVCGVACSTNKEYLSNAQKENKDLTGIMLYPVVGSNEDATVVVDNLEPGQTYYYCAYTCDSGCRFWQFGPVKSFTTESMEAILAIDEINAKFVVAEVTGHTNFPETMTGLSYVFNYSLTDVSYPIQYDVKMKVDGNSLSAVVQNLNPDHRYECWITVIQDGRTIAQSEKKDFKTQNPGDYILMDDATDITSTTAAINCKLSPYAYEGEKIALVYYGQDKNNLTQTTTAYMNGDHFTAQLTDLQPNTTYYYRGSALCVLSFGYGDWFYSEIKSFTTLPSEP